MKIAYVITRGDVIGGASVHLLDLAAGAKDAGYDVTVFVGGTGIFLHRLSNLGIRAVSLKYLQRDLHPFKDLRGILELRRHLALLRPDIVHLHSSKAGVVGRLAASSLSIPAVFTAHGWAFTEGISSMRRIAYQYVERVMSKFCDHIIAVSDYDRDLAVQKRVCPPTLISTVHNGIPDLRVERSRSTDKERVSMLMVARFDPQKDQESLIRAVAKVDSNLLILNLIGDGPHLGSAKRLAIDLGVQDRVVFHGACDDVPERLAAADIFVLISRWEGFPLSILEAMRANLPVIASDVGGVKEAVEDGETGFLIAREDEEALVIAIRRLLDDPDLRVEMGAKGRTTFEERFRYTHMLDATLTIYRKVVGLPHE